MLMSRYGTILRPLVAKALCKFGVYDTNMFVNSVESDPRLTVEIFRDTTLDRLDVAPVEAAIGYLNVISEGALSIAGAKRALNIGSAGRGYVDPSMVRWPRFGADINIVATSAPVFSLTEAEKRMRPEERLESVQRTIGVAMSICRVCVINVAGFSEVVSQAVTHEVGHLLQLKKRGETWDKASHCLNETCVMSPFATSTRQEERVRQTGIKALLERNGYRKAEYEAVHIRNAGFCEECARQLHEFASLQRGIKGRLASLATPAK